MKKVITYGTFDLFHQGHYNILKRAKECGDYLIVGVTSESFDMERGKLGVRDSLATRIANVKNTGFADEIIIEEFWGQKILDVKKYDVDILAIGSDWTGVFDYLKPYCEVRYLERTKNISSTELRLKDQLLTFGIMVDSNETDDFVYESKFVSGVHVDRVFSRDKDVAKSVAASNQLDGAYDNYDEFFDGIDVVFVRESLENKAEDIKRALLAGKHVISSYPIALDKAVFDELTAIAHEKQLILLDSFYCAYNRAFNQMLWMVESGTIGQVVSVKGSISNTKYNKMNVPMVYAIPAYLLNRINYGAKFDETMYSKNTLVNDTFVKYIAKNDNMIADIEITDSKNVHCELSIVGTLGRIFIDRDWWNKGSFDIFDYNTGKWKVYSYNSEGNGMRYMMREFLVMLREGKTQLQRFSHAEDREIVEIVQNMCGGDIIGG